MRNILIAAPSGFRCYGTLFSYPFVECSINSGRISHPKSKLEWQQINRQAINDSNTLSWGRSMQTPMR